jgi:hypothetical protein
MIFTRQVKKKKKCRQIDKSPKSDYDGKWILPKIHKKANIHVCHSKKQPMTPL